VQPLRIGVVRLDRAATLAAVAETARSALGVAELAELNGVPAAAVLPAGTVLKTVVGPTPSRTRKALPHSSRHVAAGERRVGDRGAR